MSVPALVRDEAGTVLGLITMEDILEEIGGDIEDEHDQPAARLKLKKPGPEAPPQSRGKE